ncbi:hypothetical protein HKD37_09G025809 [Glycine soja]
MALFSLHLSIIRLFFFFCLRACYGCLFVFRLWLLLFQCSSAVHFFRWWWFRFCSGRWVIVFQLCWKLVILHTKTHTYRSYKSLIRMGHGIFFIECWIYEHFPSVVSVVAAEDYNEMRLRACRWTSSKALPISTYRRCLDRLTLDTVYWISIISLFSGHLRWGPLTVIHRPERVVRQFDYIQTIPPHPVVSSLSAAEIDDIWMQFGDYIAPVGQLCAVPGHCSSDYLDWFYMILHPFMSLTQPGDPPRVSSVQQHEEFVEVDMYPQSMATTTPNEANIDQHHLWHAMDDFTIIADRLDRLLNLRILIEGTKNVWASQDATLDSQLWLTDQGKGGVQTNIEVLL